MSCLTFCLLLAVGGVFLLYLRISLKISTLVFAIIFSGWAWFFEVTGISLYLWTLIFISLALVLNVSPLRRILISDRIFGLLKKVLPAVSQTEWEALSAGTVWFDAELFSGRPNWKKILKFKSITLTSDEKAFLDGPVEELCAMLDDWDITHVRQDLPPNVWQYLKENRFFGLVIPKVYGGLEFSAMAHGAVITKVASRSITAAVTVMVPNSLGPAELLRHYGTAAQKEHYLPRLAIGQEVPCFALTAPEAGSDASSFPDKGIVCRGKFKDEETLGIRLNWEKRYITLAPVATVVGLAFKLYDPDGLLGDKEDLGITFALVDAGLPGVTTGKRHFPLNCAFQVGPTSGKDVFIPLDAIIGGRERVGQGWRMLMEALASGRGISLPALSTGGAKFVNRVIGAYAQVRKQFNLPIAKFEGIEEALTRIVGQTYVMNAVQNLTAGAVDSGEQPAVISGVAKYHLTDTLRRVVNDAMDIQGGAGICLGPRNLLGRFFQTTPIGITVEGANILTRSFITFNQGLLRCHPFLIKEIEAVKDPNKEKGRRQFDKALFGHLGFLLSNFCRTFILGVTGARFSSVPGRGVQKRYLRQLSRMGAAFALVADLSMMVMGGALKRKEKLTGRLADILCNLYQIVAVIKQYEAQGGEKDDLPLLRWGCENSLYLIQHNFDLFFKNFPNPVLGTLLRLIVFPNGLPYKEPSDRLGRAVAKVILSPSSVRDRLTEGIYLPTDNSEPVAILEDALQKTLAVEELERKLKAAQKTGDIKGQSLEQQIGQALEKEILSVSEAEALRLAAAARWEVITVDDFSSEELGVSANLEENP